MLKNMTGPEHTSESEPAEKIREDEAVGDERGRKNG